MQSYLFAKDKDWTSEKDKAWFEEHRESKVKEHVSAILPFKVLEKIVDKPLWIRGIAVTACLSALEVATWPLSANGVVKSSLLYRA